MAKKVLVVDDELPILNILKFNLKKSGYEVVSATNGQEAIDVARRDMPNLILCDVMMPRKNGFEVCQELKSDPVMKAIPIILLTAKGQEIDQAQGLEIGADVYMTKPFSPKVVIQRIADLIGV